MGLFDSDRWKFFVFDKGDSFGIYFLLMVGFKSKVWVNGIVWYIVIVWELEDWNVDIKVFGVRLKYEI